MDHKFILGFIFLIIVLNNVSGLTILVRPLSGTDLMPSQTINYVFNFTNDSSCNEVVLSEIHNITTDKYGIGYTEFNLSYLTSNPNYLCEYKDGSLRKVHNISDAVFTNIYSNFLNSLNNSISTNDTNETTRFNALTSTDCEAGYLVIGVQDNGTILCSADQTGASGNPKSGDGIYLYNDSNTMYLNETKLNETINLLNATGLIINWSNEISLTDTNILTTGSFNQSQFNNDSNQLNLNLTWLTDFINSALTFNINDYVLTSDIVSLVGNWTLDKINYYTKTETDGIITSIGNFSNENSTIARIGDCPSGQLVQNITTGGVECLTPTLTESDPLSLHLNQDNWNNDTDGYIYWENQNTITFNQSKLTTTYYNATTVQAIDGTTSGTVANINQYGGNSYNVTEVASSPGLDVRVNFTGVTAFNSLVIRYRSSSTESHQMDIQIYNYNEAVWEDYGTLANIDVFETKVLGVFDGDNHISGGLVQLRFLSSSLGNPSHEHYFDWVTISNGLGTPSGQEVDPYSYHKDQNINATGYNITGDYFFGNGSQLTGLTFTESDPYWTANQSSYYNKTDVDTNISDANTSMKNYVDGIVTTNNESWSTTYNSTYDGYNSTGLIKDWNESGYIIDWNSTGLIVNWSDIISSTGDNSSWNESYADSKYIIQSQEANLNVNSSSYWVGANDYNQTQFEIINLVFNIRESYITGLITSYFNTLFSGKTTDELTQGSTNLYDNQSFNETWTDTIYAPISVTGDNSTWNESYANTVYAPISEPLAYNGTLALNSSLSNYLEKDGDTGTGDYLFIGNTNTTGNVTIGSNVINEWNGTCYNTYIGGTLIQSIGCI